MTIKYAIPEIERRWRVNLAQVGPLDALSLQFIEDRYITGTRLRLRKMAAPNGDVVYKLCKKYGKTSALSQPITNLYLDEAEYALLCQLEGVVLKKRRYELCGGSLDVFVEPSTSFAVFEREFATEQAAQAYAPPDFVGEEITDDDRYSGYMLASDVGGSRTL